MDAFNFTLQALHVVAAIVVLIEAMNKLERCKLRAGDGLRQQALVVLKAVAWACLAIGAAGAFAAPLLRGIGVGWRDYGWLVSRANLGDVATMIGVAVIVLRSRLKERVTGRAVDV